jgi:hypothetical protein
MAPHTTWHDSAQSQSIRYFRSYKITHCNTGQGYRGGRKHVYGTGLGLKYYNVSVQDLIIINWRHKSTTDKLNQQQHYKAQKHKSFLLIVICYIYIKHVKDSVPDSSVSTATGYGLEGPGIESRWGLDFPHLSRLALGPTQPPVQWVPGLPWGRKRPGRDADPSSPSSTEV